MTRTRLTPEERSSQLLDLGAELFAATPYEDVHIERVAELAGVSRGLLYHYFPSKRAFFAALVRRQAETMARETQPDLTLSPVEQLGHGVETFLDHVARHRHGSRAAHHGGASADPEVRAIIEESMRLHEQRILDVLAPDAPSPDLLRVAVRSWLVMLRTIGQEWLDQPALGRDAVRDVCVGAFVGMVQGVPVDQRGDHLDRLVRELAPSPLGG
ncbi:MAG: TetR/AcrR family transcriptional regulator [Nocardioides sp.]